MRLTAGGRKRAVCHPVHLRAHNDQERNCRAGTLLDPALQQGDAAAHAIVDKAANELAAMAAAVIPALDLQNGAIALLGSVLVKNRALRTALTARLHAQFPSLSFLPRWVMPPMALPVMAEILYKQGGISYA